MAAPWDGRLATYLGSGLASARPTTPNIAPGILAWWFSTDSEELSIWDGSAWIENAALVDAPSDGTAYVRKNGAWTAVAGTDVGLPATSVPGDVVVVNPDGSLGTATPVPGTEPTVQGATRFRIVTVTAGVSGGSGWSEIDWFNQNGTEITPTSWTASNTTSGAVADLGDNTIWSSDWYSNVGIGDWVEVEFATPCKLKSVVVYAYGGGLNYTPQSWKFQYYDVGTTSWVDIDTWTRSPNWDGTDQLRTCTPITDFTPSAPVVPPVVTTDGGTLTGSLEVPDDAYDATTWNGNLETPTKNAIRDKIESILDGQAFSGAITVPGDVYDATGWNGNNEVPTKDAVRDKIEAVVAAIPSGDVQAILDQISTTQGDILYRNASDWVALSPGTSGYILQSNGAGANPTWVSKPAVVLGGSSGSRPWYWAPPTAASFTMMSNSGTTTATDDTDVGLVINGSPGGANQRHLWYEGISTSSDFDMKAHVYGDVTGLASSGVGIMAYENATSKWISMELTSSGLSYNAGTAGLNGSRSAVLTATAYTILPNVFIRIRRVGANMYVYYSSNGKNWVQWSTFTTTSRFTTGPDRVGLFWLCERTSGPDLNLTCDYYSRT